MPNLTSIFSTSEWQNSYGFTIGVLMSVTAGIPLFVDTTWEVGAEQTFEYSYGESYSETIGVRLVVVCLCFY